MPTRIKICGVNDPTTAAIAAEAGADAIGLVFVDGSPRRVSIERASEILDGLPAFVEPVALFVDAPTERIRSTAATLGIRTVQLHGNEPVDDLRVLQPLRVIKAVPFRGGDSARAESARWLGLDNLAGLLFDAPAQTVAMPGGGGRAFDWAALTESRDTERPQAAPLILAGGLNPRNVAEAIRTVQPYAVDVSSGVESKRGVKDPELIREFCAAVSDTDRRVVG